MKSKSLIINWRGRRYGRRDRWFIGQDMHATSVLVELDTAIDQCKERPVAADADVATWVKLGSALANDNRAGGDFFPSVDFNAQALGVAVTTVPGTSLTFLVCHNSSRLNADFLDFDHRQFLSVTLLFVITLAAVHLPYDDLVAADMLHDVSNNAGPGNRRSANTNVTGVAYQQHPVEHVRLAGIHRQQFDFKLISGGDPILFATGFHDSVHKFRNDPNPYQPLKKGTRSKTPTAKVSTSDSQKLRLINSASQFVLPC